MPALDEWRRAAGSDAAAEALLRARARWERHNAATLGHLRRVYRRAARDIRDELRGLAPGALRQRHLLAMLDALERRAAQLSGEVLDAVLAGIRLSVERGAAGPEAVAQQRLEPLGQPEGVARLFAAVNERAAAALVSRTGPDGLVLSDRTWRAGRRWRRAAQTVVEDGVARGLSARDLARQLQQYLAPGVFTAHKRETRRRLGVPTDVSYEALRLARTEMANAFHEGTILANQAVPGYQGVLWRLSAAHPMRDVCDDLAESRAHGRPGFYPVGQEPTRPHPQCLCTLLPVHEDEDAFTDRLVDWLSDPYRQPDIEQWYTETAGSFLVRPPAHFGTGGRAA